MTRLHLNGARKPPRSAAVMQETDDTSAGEAVVHEDVDKDGSPEKTTVDVYDTDGRLIQRTINEWVLSERTIHMYNEDDQVTLTVETLDWDRDGVEDDVTTTKYVYDSEAQLIEVISQEDHDNDGEIDATITTIHVYDSNGNRVETITQEDLDGDGVPAIVSTEAESTIQEEADGAQKRGTGTRGQVRTDAECDMPDDWDWRGFARDRYGFTQEEIDSVVKEADIEKWKRSLWKRWKKSLEGMWDEEPEKEAPASGEPKPRTAMPEMRRREPTYEETKWDLFKALVSHDIAMSTGRHWVFGFACLLEDCPWEKQIEIPHAGGGGKMKEEALRRWRSQQRMIEWQRSLERAYRDFLRQLRSRAWR